MTESERTLEQVYHSAVSGLYARLKNNYDYLYDKFGDEGLEMITEMSWQYGLNIAQRARKSLTGNDIDAVAGYLMRIFETVYWGKDETLLIRESPERIIIKVEDCPLHFKNPEMCLAHTTMEKTVVEELNPGLTYRIGKSIPAGDDFCEHIVEKATP